jgi:hypothetical protein
MYSSKTPDEELVAIKTELAKAEFLCLGGDSLVDTRLLVRSSIVVAAPQFHRLGCSALTQDGLTALTHAELLSERQGHLRERRGV